MELGEMNNNQTGGKWESVLNDITHLYKNIEKESLALPVFSLMPILISTWAMIKFEILFLLDIFLLIPMNAIIFIRNIFPGHWRYRSFSWHYIKYAAVWVWRGEIPYFPLAIIRPIVRLILAAHIINRLTLIKTYIYLDETLPEQKKEYLYTQINKQIEHWSYPGVLHIILTYVLPLSAPVIEGYRIMFPGQLPEWSSFLLVMLLSYTLGFIVTSFMVKRAIMLGASGKAASFPGSIEGAGNYKNEKSILSSVKISKSEFPWDIVLFFIGITMAFLTLDVSIQFYMSVGLEVQKEGISVQMMIQGVVFSLLLLLSKYRRKITGRE